MRRPLFFLVPFVVLLSACPTEGGGGLLCPYVFDGRAVDTAYGDPAIDGLLEATAGFVAASNDLDTSVRNACNAIATDLGAATSPTDTRVACESAATAIQLVLDQNAMATLTVGYVPAECTTSASFIAECTAMCDASFDVMATPPRCEGGELTGTCSGMCSGSCTLEGEVACSGTCRGTCMGSCDATVSGTCEGTCMGQCEGTCSTMAADGSCMGTCTGTCEGRCTGTVQGECSGTCEGNCMGSCRAEVSGTCNGSCSGMCDVMFTEPRCEGGELVVDADVDCEAACQAEASFEVECTPPELIITFTGSAEDQMQLEALFVTLERNLPALLEALAKLRIVVEASVDLAGRLRPAGEAAASISLEAAECFVLAVQAQAAAAARIQVSIEVSVMVSASASVTAE